MIAGAVALALMSPLAGAKPIAFAKGKTVMAELGAGTMNELQAFYAPKYWFSTGVGWTELSSADGNRHRTFTYVRANLLAHRWNLPGAQANIFVWGGLGQATANELASPELAREAGAQFDFETRRVYV